MSAESDRYIRRRCAQVEKLCLKADSARWLWLMDFYLWLADIRAAPIRKYLAKRDLNLDGPCDPDPE